MIGRAAALLLLLASGQALGHVPSMKSDNFENARIGSSVPEECPFSEADVDKIWDAELLRARLKRDSGISEGALWFDAGCLKLNGEESWIFDIEVEWTWAEVRPDGIEYSGKTEGFPNMYPEVTVSGTIGVGGKDFALEGVRKIIADAITKYLRANLD